MTQKKKDLAKDLEPEMDNLLSVAEEASLRYEHGRKGGQNDPKTLLSEADNEVKGSKEKKPGPNSYLSAAKLLETYLYRQKKHLGPNIHEHDAEVAGKIERYLKQMPSDAEYKQARKVLKTLLVKCKYNAKRDKNA